MELSYCCARPNIICKCLTEVAVHCAKAFATPSHGELSIPLMRQQFIKFCSSNAHGVMLFFPPPSPFTLR